MSIHLVKVYSETIRTSSTKSLILFLNRIIRTSHQKRENVLSNISSEVLEKLRNILGLKYRDIAFYSYTNKMHEQDIEDNISTIDITVTTAHSELRAGINI